MSTEILQSIVDCIGQDQIQDRLGVKSEAVRKAIVKGIFPSLWYVAIRDMGRDRGVYVDEALFSFKGVPDRAA